MASIEVIPFLPSGGRPGSPILALLIVSVPRGCGAGDEACAGSRYYEDRGSAKDDTRRPEAPRAEEVAQDAERYLHRPGRQIHTRAQDRKDDAPSAEEQPHDAADPPQEQL